MKKKIVRAVNSFHSFVATLQAVQRYATMPPEIADMVKETLKSAEGGAQ